MRTLRTALTAAALCLLCAGYASSQIAYFQGTFADYAAKVDSAPIQRLALLFLIAAVVLTFIKDRDEYRRAVSDRESVDSPFTIHDSRGPEQ